MNKKKLQQNLKTLLLTMTLGTGLLGEYKIASDIVESQHQQKMQKELEKQEDEAFEELLPDQELELSKEAEEAMNEISRQVNYTPYLEALNINKATFLSSYANTEDTTSHTYTALYDSSTDSIDWKKAIDYIYVNSMIKADEEDNTYAPAKSEVIEYVSSLQEAYNQIKSDFTKYDTKKLACKLEYFAILKSSTQETSTTTATTNNSEIILNPIYNILSEKLREDTIKHEGLHLAVCDCIDSKRGVLFGTSILSMPAPRVKEDLFITERYHWRFIEEGYTALYTKEMTKGFQESYITYDEAIDLLQAILALNENYQVDDILKQIIYQKPVEFIKNFPVYGQDKEKFMLDNLKALKGLDILVGANEQWINYLDSNYPKLDYTNEAQLEMSQAIHKQFAKIYFNNLIVLNEQHPEMTVEDNTVFLDLFFKLMNNIVIDSSLVEENTTLREMIEAQNIEVRPLSQIQVNYNQELVPAFPETTFLDYRNIYIEYLAKRYQKPVEELKQEMLSGEPMKNDYQFPEFLGPEKKEFYQFLYDDNRKTEDSYPRTLVKQK